MQALIDAVANQVGSLSFLKEISEDVMNHGADCGFNGFIYCSETEEFFFKNRKLIIKLLRDNAEEVGYRDAISVVSDFRCLRNTDTSLDDIGITLYGDKDELDTTVANALAWYALEAACVLLDYYDDCIDEDDDRGNW